MRPNAPERSRPTRCQDSPRSRDRYMPVPPSVSDPPPGFVSPVPANSVPFGLIAKARPLGSDRPATPARRCCWRSSSSTHRRRRRDEDLAGHLDIDGDVGDTAADVGRSNEVPVRRGNPRIALGRGTTDRFGIGDGGFPCAEADSVPRERPLVVHLVLRFRQRAVGNLGGLRFGLRGRRGIPPWRGRDSNQQHDGEHERERRTGHDRPPCPQVAKR